MDELHYLRRYHAYWLALVNERIAWNTVRDREIEYLWIRRQHPLYADVRGTYYGRRSV